MSYRKLTLCNKVLFSFIESISVCFIFIKINIWQMARNLSPSYQQSLQPWTQGILNWQAAIFLKPLGLVLILWASVVDILNCCWKQWYLFKKIIYRLFLNASNTFLQADTQSSTLLHSECQNHLNLPCLTTSATLWTPRRLYKSNVPQK